MEIIVLKWEKDWLLLRIWTSDSATLQGVFTQKKIYIYQCNDILTNLNSMLAFKFEGKNVKSLDNRDFDVHNNDC